MIRRQTLRDAMVKSGLSLAMGLAVAASAHHPHDPIHALAVSPQLETDGTLLVSSQGTMNAILRSTDHGRTWHEARAGLTGRRVDAFEFSSDYATSKRIYAVTNFGGLQVSNDAGLHWDPPLQQGVFCKLAVGEAHAAGTSIVYGDEYALFLSLDGGLTTRKILGVSGADAVANVSLSPAFSADSTVAVAMADSAVLISRNLGREWSRVPVPAEPQVVRFAPGDPSLLWLATWGGGVFRSTDGGNTFLPLGRGITDLDVNDVGAAPSFPNPPHLWAATRDAGVFQSLDGGENWTLLPYDGEKDLNKTDHFWRILPSPQYPRHRTLYLGAHGGLFGSFNGGTKWYGANLNPPRFGRNLVLSPNFSQDGRIFATGYGMPIIASEDKGNNWQIRATGFDAISTHCISLSPNWAIDSLAICGVAHGIRMTRDGGRSYEAVELAVADSLDVKVNDMRSVVFSPTFAQDRTIFAQGSGGFYRTTDGGSNWEVSFPAGRRAWFLGISPHFSSDSTLFVSGPEVTEGVYRTTNGGRTWQPAGDWRGVARAVHVSAAFATTGEVFVVAGREGILASTDRGQTWSPRSQGLFGVQPTAMALSRDFATNGIAVLVTESHGVFETRNGGELWTQISGDAASVMHGESVALAPDYPVDPTLLVGGFEGYERSTDRGVTWHAASRIELYDDARREPWVRRGVWTDRGDLPGAINGGVQWSDSFGSTMMLPFQGTGARLFVRKGPDQGEVRVVLDGRYAQVVDLYSAVVEEQVVAAEIQGLPQGFHTLTVRVQGGRNPLSTGTVVSVDGMEVTHR